MGVSLESSMCVNVGGGILFCMGVSIGVNKGDCIVISVGGSMRANIGSSK